MIIIIYLSVVGALLLYMAFLVLVDPLIRKPDAYTQPLHNEEENEVRLCCWHMQCVAALMVEPGWWDGRREWQTGRQPGLRLVPSGPTWDQPQQLQ